MVTAEFAVALPAFVLVVAAALGGVATVTAQLRCTDAAATAARLAARGEATSLVRSTALAAAPGGSSLAVSSTATTVTATVRASISVPGLGRVLPAIAVRATAVAAREPATDASGPQP
jgi:Flp pilus assembly protein TadG